MYLKDFDTAQRKFAKMRKHLSEAYGYKLKTKGLTAQKATAMLESTKAKLAKADASDAARLTLIAESLKLFIEGWEHLPPMPDKYVARDGLEGPIMTRSGKVVYYDPKEGSYYDPDTDMYMSYDDWRALDNDRNGPQTEGTDMKKVNESVDEDTVDAAKVILAAQEMTDEMQKMLERIAKMQVQELLPIVEAMKAEIGFEQAQAFESTVGSTLATLMDGMKSAKADVENAIHAVQGNEVPTDMEMDMSDESATDLDFDADEDMGDDFGAAESEAEVEGDDGREMKEEATFESALLELKAKAHEGKVARADLNAIVEKYKKYKGKK